MFLDAGIISLVGQKVGSKESMPGDLAIFCCIIVLRCAEENLLCSGIVLQVITGICDYKHTHLRGFGTLVVDQCSSVAHAVWVVA